jgi:cyclic-di-AMP phosphodiesterase PgpH
MKGERGARGRSRPAGAGSSFSFARRLSFPTRVRDALRRGADRFLAADVAWSALLVAVTLLLLGGQRAGIVYEPLSVGEVAPRDITAPGDLEVLDEALTLKRRQEARDHVPDLFLHDTGWVARLEEDLQSLFDAGRRILSEESASKRGPEAALVEQLGGRLPAGALEVLIRHGFGQELESAVAGSIRSVMEHPIVANRAPLTRQGVILLSRLPRGTEERRVTDFSAFLELEEARTRIREEVDSALALPAEERSALGDLAAGFLEANVFYDLEGTAARRDAAAAAVPKVLVKIPRGSVLLRAGELITPEALARLEAARDAAARSLGPPEFLGLVTLVLLLAFFLYRYTRYHQRNYKKVRNLHALLILVMLSMLLLSQGLLWVAHGVVDDLGEPFNQIGLYTYLIPLGGGAILVALLANGRIAMVYSAFTAVLFGMLFGLDTLRLTWALVVQWAGIYAIATYRERTALLRAGLVVGGAGAATALAVEALRGPLEPMGRAMFAGGLSFLGGALGVGLVVSFALPLLEGLFKVLTDVRLLELSNASHPLLSQLALKAPGSYNHSLVVGTLAEEAAKSIGANSLFCRVAAFYHDIGKIRKAEYFVENQRGVNPHDRLTPSMSALVIASHVKDGIKMAREAGLPEQIVDIIPQHHGTRLMSYFFDKAKRQADPELPSVQEGDFRYPGPKPRTREAAIFMLSDAVEAAARTVEDPTPSRLKEVIRKVTNAIVLDGQLDECDLTFSDLERIQEAFLRSVVSMYHHRVDYPGFEFNRQRAELRNGDAGRRGVRGG